MVMIHNKTTSPSTIMVKQDGVTTEVVLVPGLNGVKEEIAEHLVKHPTFVRMSDKWVVLGGPKVEEPKVEEPTA